MSIVVRYAPAGLTKAQYDETSRLFEQEFGEDLPDGCDYHVCFGSDGDLHVSEIWDSREQWEAFGERLMPLLAQWGIEFQGQPEVYEVHTLQRR
jgi:hypothetical protein